MKKNTDSIEIIPTTSRALINDWTALRDIMAQISCTQKEKQEKVPEQATYLLQMLSDRQLEDAFRGPFRPFIQTLIDAYSLLSRLRTRFVITQDDNLRPHVQDTNFDLPADMNTDINVAALDKKQRELDEAARHHYRQWQEQIKQWQESLVMQVTMNGTALSENEINEMQQTEPLSELLDLFTDLELELPKIKSTYYQFADYLTLKLTLCIHSALSRQHVSEAEDAMQKALKDLKATFKTISQQESELIHQQNTNIETLMKW